MKLLEDRPPLECRPDCGACCIAPSINTPFFGMPDGKPAGVRCVHLAEDLRCALWQRPERPHSCGAFTPEPWVCGSDRDQALSLITLLELETGSD